MWCKFFKCIAIYLVELDIQCQCLELWNCNCALSLSLSTIWFLWFYIFTESCSLGYGRKDLRKVTVYEWIFNLIFMYLCINTCVCVFSSLISWSYALWESFLVSYCQLQYLLSIGGCKKPLEIPRKFLIWFGRPWTKLVVKWGGLNINLLNGDTHDKIKCYSNNNLYTTQRELSLKYTLDYLVKSN